MNSIACGARYDRQRTMQHWGLLDFPADGKSLVLGTFQSVLELVAMHGFSLYPWRPARQTKPPHGLKGFLCSPPNVFEPTRGQRGVARG